MELPLDAARCSRCKATAYCDRDCQRNHWALHKVNCKPFTPPAPLATSADALNPTPAPSPMSTIAAAQAAAAAGDDDYDEELARKSRAEELAAEARAKSERKARDDALEMARQKEAELASERAAHQKKEKEVAAAPALAGRRAAETDTDSSEASAVKVSPASQAAREAELAEREKIRQRAIEYDLLIRAEEAAAAAAASSLTKTPAQAPATTSMSTPVSSFASGSAPTVVPASAAAAPASRGGEPQIMFYNPPPAPTLPLTKKDKGGARDGVARDGQTQSNRGGGKESIGSTPSSPSQVKPAPQAPAGPTPASIERARKSAREAAEGVLRESRIIAVSVGADKADLAVSILEGSAGMSNLHGLTVDVDDGLGGPFSWSADLPSSRSLVLTDLVPGRRYRARLRATLVVSGDPAQAGPVAILHGPMSSFTTKSVAPGSAPKTLALAQRQRNSLTLSWAPPAETGGVALDALSYNLEIGERGRYSLVYQGKENHHKMTGLQPGASYTFRCQAVNEHGAGPFTAPAEFSTAASVPDMPGPLMCHHATETSLQLGWNAVKDNGSPITSYSVEMQEPVAPGSRRMPPPQIVYNSIETTCTVSGLSPATLYSFKVRAHNDVGASVVLKEPAVFMTASRRPGTPAAPKLEGRTRNSIHFSWVAPHTDPGSPITVYRAFVAQHVPGQALQYLEVYRGLDLDRHVLDMSPGTEYHVAITGSNALGESDLSPALVVRTLADAPFPPGPPSVPNTSSTTCTLAWVPPIDRGAPITRYDVELMVLHNDALVSVPVFTGLATTCTISDLSPNSQYSFRVRAHNDSGMSEWSEVSDALTGPGAPDCPSEPTLASSGAHTAELTWAAAKDNGSTITGYLVVTGSVGESSDPSSPESLSLALSSAAARKYLWDGSTLGCTLTDLTPSSTFVVHVIAVNRVGMSVPSSGVKITTQAAPPSRPTKVSAEAMGPDRIRLTWPPAEGYGSPVDMYTITSDNATFTSFETIGTTSELSFMAHDLKPGSKYTFRVLASNSAGTSAPSLPTSATTSGAPPLPTAPPVLISATPSALRFKWREAISPGCVLRTYHVEISPAGAGKWAAGAIVDALSGKRETRIQNLAPNTPYDVRIAGENAFGRGQWSDVITFSTIQLGAQQDASPEKAAKSSPSSKAGKLSATPAASASSAAAPADQIPGKSTVTLRPGKKGEVKPEPAAGSLSPPSVSSGSGAKPISSAGPDTGEGEKSQQPAVSKDKKGVPSKTKETSKPQPSDSRSATSAAVAEEKPDSFGSILTALVIILVMILCVNFVLKKNSFV